MNYLDAIKYPKTFHFDFSGSLINDDRELESTKGFEGKRVIVTEKLDGENASIYNGYYHPRSVTDDGHPSRNWLKGFKANFDYLIPEGWRVCGENVYAEHSIRYENLDTFFYVFNIWDKNNICFEWDKTVEYCKEWGLMHVPVLYDGVFDYDHIKQIYENLDFSKQEGIVCRVATSFHYDDFQKFTAKAVRPKHVATDEHWTKTWKPNSLKK